MESRAKHDQAEVRRPQADGSVVFVGPHLRVRVAVLKPGVVLATAQGEVVGAQDVSAEAALLAELELELERAGTLTLFADLRQSPRVPAASRDRLALWASRHQGRLLPSHVLVQSKLLEMAMSLITMLVGSGVIEIHTKPQAFLAMVKAVAPNLSELPGIPER